MAATRAHFGAATILPSFVEMVAFAMLIDAVVAVATGAAAEEVVVDAAFLLIRFHSPNPYASAEENHRHCCDMHAEPPSPDEVFD